MRPTVRVPCASLRGNLRCSVMGRHCGTRFAAAQRRSDNRSESDHDAGACFAAPARPTPCASRHGQRGLGKVSGHRCARPRTSGAARSACRWWPSEAMAHVDFNRPSGCAWGGVLAGWRLHRRMQPLRDLTGRGCLNGALSARSEFCGPTRQRPDPGRPAAKRRGRRQQGRLSLGYFSLAKQRKVARPPGRDPASALN